MTLHPIFFCVALPPPVHGQSLVNAYVLERLQTDPSFLVTSVDIAPIKGRGSLYYHGSRIRRVFRGLLEMAALRSHGKFSAYFVYESGLGIVYNYLLIGLARLLGASIFLHHHTAGHCQRYEPGFFMLNKLCGLGATHIVLSKSMSSLLCERYGLVRVMVCENACVIEQGVKEASEVTVAVTKATAGRAIRIGHLSNLTVEKGVVILLSAVGELLSEGLSVELYLAGPINDDVVRVSINEFQIRHPGALHVVGPVHGYAKRQFFAELDIFVFPSVYKLEAQPLVVLESLAAGVPCIVSDAGFTGELPGKAGVTVSDLSELTSVLRCYVDGDESSIARLGLLKKEAPPRFAALKKRSLEQVSCLVSCMRFNEG
jgi:glycosyltransferase involved in cell wall biosynthesis